ncbi:hypothetical protein [Moritella marina]|uniref:hypothetical protein n=1 Tax=Moritella marina TaxID=90736 RepID=UPI0037040197
MDIKYIWSKKSLSSVEVIEGDLAYLKRNTPIAIIDDQPFPDLESYRNAGYSVTQFTDIDSFDQLVSFPIIICDIQGVGRNFGDTSEGAYIVKEIKDLYPDKYVIVASSHASSLKVASMISAADQKISRGDGDALKTAVNNAVKIMGNDVERWRRIRLHLIHNKNIDLFEVWKIEQEFISALAKKDSKGFESFVNKHTPDMIKGLLINFVSGIIF